MNLGLYTAASGMIVQREKQEVTARNLANANVTGYKKEELVTEAFSSVLEEEKNDVVDNKINTAYLYNEPKTVFTQGELKFTGNNLDVALEGKGFLHVRSPEFGEMYIRDGRLRINKDGELVTQTHGYKVIDVSGQTIRIKGSDQGDPSSYMQKIFIAPDGSIGLMQSDLAAPAQLARMRVVEFDDPAELENIGYGLYRKGNSDTIERLSFNTNVRQQYLERPNLNIVTEMRNMILNERLFDANQRAVKEIDKSISAVISGVGSR